MRQREKQLSPSHALLSLLQKKKCTENGDSEEAIGEVWHLLNLIKQPPGKTIAVTTIKTPSISRRVDRRKSGQNEETYSNFDSPRQHVAGIIGIQRQLGDVFC